MPTLVAFLPTPPAGGGAVSTVAAAVGTVLGLTVDERVLPAVAPEATATVLEAAQDPAVRLVVLPSSAGRGSRTVDDIISRLATPVVLVPPTSPPGRRTTISRVLVPLNGSRASAEAVDETVQLFAESGADVLVLHVFDSSNVPCFWDHPEHSPETWAEEFLARNFDRPGARMELRAGEPGERVLDVADSEHADLIALGWSQDLSSDRARTVRATIASSQVPVLLIPVADTWPGDPVAQRTGHECTGVPSVASRT